MANQLDNRITEHPNMVDYPVAKAAKDERVASAAALWFKNPGLLCTQIMLTRKFTADDSHNHAKQMWIHQRAPTKKSLKKPKTIVLAEDVTAES